MGVEAALIGAGMSAGTAGAISTGLTIFSGLSSIMGGISSSREGGRQGDIALMEADRRAREEVRVSEREAALAEEDAEETRRAQKVAFLASGVELEGSPLLVMEETRRKGLENAAEIRRAGSSSAIATMEEGRATASRAKSTGRTAFTSGLTRGAMTIGGALA